MGKKRVYLITGASGFIGSCLARRLVQNKEEVHLLLHKGHKSWRLDDLKDKVKVCISDLSDQNVLNALLRKIKPTVIYHLAAYGAYSSQNDPDQCIKTNVQGTCNLLKATADIDYELLVNTGTSSEYGFKKLPMKEDDLLEPFSYYAVTKSSQTMLCSYFAKKNNKPIVTLRPFSVYGPYEEGARFVPTLLTSLHLQKEMKLVSPNIARDWVHVDDMVDAYLLIDQLKQHRGEVFNIGTGIQTTIKEVAELAAGIVGKPPVFKWGGMKNKTWDTDHWVADTAKTRKLLNWKAKIPLKQGLKNTLEWMIRQWNL